MPRINIVISRKAEIYSGAMPLAWLMKPLASRFDRKSSAFIVDLPDGAALNLYDGTHEPSLIVVGGPEQTLRFKAAKLEGALTCLNPSVLTTPQ